MRAKNLLKHTQRRKSSLSSPVVFGLMFAAGFFMLIQTPGLAEAAADTGMPEFKVLDVSTGSGSRTKEAAKPQVQFEVLEVSTGSGMGLKGQETIVPAVTPPLAPVVTLTEPVETAPVITAQKRSAAKAANPEAGKTPQPEELDRTAIFASLEKWHQQTLADYNYNIGALQDPFLPIKEVRGTPEEEEEDNPDDPRKPMILRMRLNQLKLVAITTLTDRPGGSLASFEDGAGASYILRQGDLIGRNNGRITSIESSQVTVEEPPRGSARDPEITVMKLDVLSSSGLTRASDINQQEQQAAAPIEETQNE